MNARLRLKPLVLPVNRSFATVVAIIALAVGCNSGARSSQNRPTTVPRDQYLIVAAELESTSRDNLYDAVRQLRPGWFTRSTRNRTGDESILVYLDDRQIGTASIMRRFTTSSVGRVRYLSPTEAQVKYGQINVGRPAILIESARQP